ncbi:MAG: serine/threonine-protein kinase, partial [Pseudomonadota bacterium]
MTGQADKWDQLLTTGGGLLAGGEEPAEDWSGRRLGAFELTEQIGVGGMASVYRAKRVDQFEQQVAIKVLAAELAEPEHQQRFVQERQILARLDHPGIARIIDGGVADDRPYLVMELVTGQPLDQYLQSEQPEFADRARILAGIARAVQHAHGHQVVHQDLKPANVLINEDDEPKLLDFGIAGAGESSESRPFLLTPLYAAPEQYAESSTSAATDIFQMGVLICRTLTGEHPFIADARPSMPEVRRRMEAAVLRKGLTSRLPAGLREDVDHILACCLAADPAARYETIAHLKQDLEALADDRPLPGRLTESGYRLRRFLRGRRLELGVAAGLAAAAVFAATAIWQELEDRRAQVAASGENTAAMGEVVSEILQIIDPLTPGAEPLDDVISSANFEKLTTATRDQPQVQREMVISSGRALLDSGRYGAVINLVEPLVAELEAVDPK